MSTYTTKLGSDPFAIVFTSNTASGTFKYKARIEGKGSIDKTTTKAFSQASVLNIGYSCAGAKGDFWR